MFDYEQINHSNSSKDSNQPDEQFEDSWKWNNSPPTNDNEEQKKNCIPKWPENSGRNLDFDEKKGERKYSIEMESTSVQEENKLNQQ